MLTLQQLKYRVMHSNIHQPPIDKAAVLVPIVEQHHELYLLFQVRSSHLSAQPNDICFPGGRIEQSDLNPSHTAIRETHEELGIAMQDISVYHELPPFMSAIGYEIYPIIGEIQSLDNLHLNHDEVEEIFLVPLNWLLNYTPIKSSMLVGHKPGEDFPFDLVPTRSSGWQKRSEHTLFFYHYDKYVIWGLTAQIVRSFLNTLQE